MKVSLYHLDQARGNPRRFGEKLAFDAFTEKKGRYNANQFRTYLTKAIGAYHAGGSWPKILLEFEAVCRKRLQRLHYFNERTDRYVEVLKGYFRGFPAEGLTHLEMGKRFSLRVGRHEVTGKIDRLDLRQPHGFQSTDIQMHVTRNWTRKLRWPLVQEALAEDLNAPPAEIRVGVHAFDTGLAHYNCFGAAEIEAALAEAEEICDEIQDAHDGFDLDAEL